MNISRGAKPRGEVAKPKTELARAKLFSHTYIYLHIPTYTYICLHILTHVYKYLYIYIIRIHFTYTLYIYLYVQRRFPFIATTGFRILLLAQGKTMIFALLAHTFQDLQNPWLFLMKTQLLRAQNKPKIKIFEAYK